MLLFSPCAPPHMRPHHVCPAGNCCHRAASRALGAVRCSACGLAQSVSLTRPPTQPRRKRCEDENSPAKESHLHVPPGQHLADAPHFGQVAFDVQNLLFGRNGVQLCIPVGVWRRGGGMGQHPLPGVPLSCLGGTEATEEAPCCRAEVPIPCCGRRAQ